MGGCPPDGAALREIELSVAGMRVFIVEDEPLILFALEDMLADLGCEIVASAMRVPEALGKAEALAFDIAILDVNIAGDRVDPVADLLAARGVPFVFATGYGPSAAPDRHRERRVIAKPYRTRDLHEALAASLPGRS